jgi:hypothetical protein
LPRAAFLADVVTKVRNPGDPMRDVQLRRAIDIVGASRSR